ncbi:DUF397 domain-containing protein [Streptomyces sp. CB02923]|uniref:DUF397 domain-containing protein n=1 Tax=Streptomyces sp. CB02923 TaxID=1718985 RepID=UPI00093A3228|nr:DUF397 domain-containing protein [Streptomyces sp. CB02923]OKH97842.1 DUF397 domain-containing protein [Streptomyces sp. CB02923]
MTLPLDLAWSKSTYSSPGGGSCLEWSPSTAEATGTVPIRDSKAPEGPVLALSLSAFADFIAGVKSGAFSG